jgi:hypothetical protein
MSSRVRSIVVLAALVTLAGTAVLRFGSADSDAAVSTTLHATVGPAFDISLTFDDGSAVSALPAGPYRVVVRDITPDHNFHLLGPGVDEETGVDFTGSATWNVTFSSGGRYQFLCDIHADSMFGRFDAGAVSDASSSGAGGSTGGVSTGGVSTGGGSSSGSGSGVRNDPVTAFIGSLAAGLDAGGKLKLTAKGKAVKTLAAGKYSFVVSDSSKQSALTLRRTGGAAQTLTGAAFVGKKTIAVTLAAGQWKLYPSTKPAGAISFVVTKT